MDAEVEDMKVMVKRSNMLLFTGEDLFTFIYFKLLTHSRPRQ